MSTDKTAKINAAAMRAAILFIEENLGAYGTRETQIEALDEFAAAQDVKIGKLGWDAYPPTGLGFRTMLKGTVAPFRKRARRYQGMTPEEVVMQLFAAGRSVLDDAGDYLELPPLNATANSASSKAEGPRASHITGSINKGSTSATGPSKESQARGGKKNTRGKTAIRDAQKDLATNDSGTETPKGSQARSGEKRKPETAIDQERMTKRPPGSGTTVEQTSSPHQRPDETDVEGQTDLPEHASIGNHPRENGVSTGNFVDIMAIPLERGLQHLHRAIAGTASVVFPDRIADRLAQLDISPSPGLCALYQQTLANATATWKSVAMDLLGKRVLTARMFFQSLLWSFVRTSVLENTSSLNDLHRLLDASMAPGGYLNQVLSSQHDLDVEDFRREVVDAQFNDERFRQETVGPQAAGLANDLMLILAGHLDQLDKSGLPRDWYKDVVSRLEAVCQDALMFQARLLGGTRKWNLVTFSNGDAPIEHGMDVDPRYPGSHVAIMIMPGLCFQDEEADTRDYQPAALVAMGDERR